MLFLAGYSTFETIKIFTLSCPFLSMREMYNLPQAAMRYIMIGMAKLCEDSVKIAEEKVRRQLVDIIPEDCDLSDCFDISDHGLFQDCRSDWLRNQFFKKHFHVVVCKFAGFL